MRLTQWTDYALRVLMYCAVHAQRESAPTIAEIAEVHGISRSHLMKIVMELSAKGWLSTSRGRGGGLRLLRPAQDMVIGEVVRQMEEDFTLVECFNTEGSACRIDGRCRLKGVLDQALQAYMQTLDGVTLADLVAPGTGVSHIPLTAVKRMRASRSA
ncbi:MAG: RrF2 family transcriptional regulator [Limnohabitans sp.]